tara:strand:- start:9527 stop:10027 length:501 start_codon:yes stop_codon:yes gene_type:complete
MSLFPRYGQQNPYLDFKIAGRYGSFGDNTIDIGSIYGLDVFDENKKPDSETERKDPSARFYDYLIKKDEQAEEDKAYYRSEKYLRTQAELADEIAARQMERAQQYGERSAMLGFLYKGVPEMVKDMKFAKYAGADAALAGIRDNFGRISMPQVQAGRYFQNMPLLG